MELPLYYNFSKRTLEKDNIITTGRQDAHWVMIPPHQRNSHGIYRSKQVGQGHHRYNHHKYKDLYICINIITDIQTTGYKDPYRCINIIRDIATTGYKDQYW